MILISKLLEILVWNFAGVPIFRMKYKNWEKIRRTEGFQPGSSFFHKDGTMKCLYDSDNVTFSDLPNTLENHYRT